MKELDKYIKENIIPVYNKNEKSHDVRHVTTVINNIMEIAEKQDLNSEIAYTIAAFHDIGHHIDAKNHEKVSAEILSKDEFIKNYFNEEEIKLIKEAIEDHRSSKKEEPRSIYGKAICSADRSVNLNDILKRAYDYGKFHFPTYTEEEQIERVYNHLAEKFGENGYANVYFETENYKRDRQEIVNVVNNKEEFLNKINAIIKDE